LLKYLEETDRVEEITKEAWEKVPYKAINELLYSIDESWTDDANITYAISFGDHPEGIPQEYLSYEEFLKRFQPIQDKMENETYDITEEIEDLQSQLEDLEQEKTTIEQPYRKELSALADTYLRSRRLLIHCLYLYYEGRKEKWPREKYALGFPKGCLVNALKEGKDLASFIAQVNTTKAVLDIESALREALSNGEIQRLIFNVVNGGKQDG